MKIQMSLIFSFMLSFCAAAREPEFPSFFEAKNVLTAQKVEVRLVDESRKGSVLIFMSAKCPCSNSHVALLKELSTQFKEFRFFAIHSNPDETIKETEFYFKTIDLPFEVLQDEKTKLADSFRAYKTPHAFVFNAKGKVIYQGGVTNSTNAAKAEHQYLANALKDTTDGKPVRLSEGRTLGCVILREGERNVF